MGPRTHDVHKVLLCLNHKNNTSSVFVRGNWPSAMSGHLLFRSPVPDQSAQPRHSIQTSHNWSTSTTPNSCISVTSLSVRRPHRLRSARHPASPALPPGAPDPGTWHCPRSSPSHPVGAVARVHSSSRHDVRILNSVCLCLLLSHHSRRTPASELSPW